MCRLPAHANLGGQLKNLVHNVPKPSPGLQSRVNFWIEIYSRYTTEQAVIHDSDNLEIIYGVLNLRGKTHAQKKLSIKSAKTKYKNILEKLASQNNHKNLSPLAKRIKILVKNDFSSAAKRIRSQTGQADRFEKGIERSGKYMYAIKKVFLESGLPLELSMLPHVESSFNIGAYSSASAAGIWQFTRSTGRLFMQIDNNVDERWDPFISTKAAAALLERNFRELQSWPLAITAYNHGLNGMKRAKMVFGNNIEEIIRNYNGQSFGFASKNFYCEFLAALHVATNKEKYFKNLKIASPLIFDTITLDHFYDFKLLAKSLGVSAAKLAKLNWGLRPPVIDGEKRVPRGYVLKVPKASKKAMAARLAKIPAQYQFNEQKRSKYYKIKRGDTLGHIAKRFKTTVHKLRQLNRLNSKSKILIGKYIRVPEASKAIKAKNPEKALPPSRKPVAGTHVVKKNESLIKIAKSYGITTQKLLKLNGLKKNSLIFPGQTLVIKEPGANLQTVPRLFKTRANLNNTPSDKEGGGGQKPAEQMALSEIKLLKKGDDGFLGIVTVENNETIGLYSQWSEQPIQEIRKINQLQYDKSIAVGDKIKLVLSKEETTERFKNMRREYHYGIRKNFYSNYEVTGTHSIKIKQGQNLWEICQVMYDIPYWLLKDYNPNANLVQLKAGQVLNIPIINPKSPERSDTDTI